MNTEEMIKKKVKELRAADFSDSEIVILLIKAMMNALKGGKR